MTSACRFKAALFGRPCIRGRVHTRSGITYSPPLPSTPSIRGLAKQYRLEAQRKNSHDETTEPVSTDRRLVLSRSCVQTSDAAGGRAGPRAEKNGVPVSKELVSIKLDSDLLAHFKRMGRVGRSGSTMRCGGQRACDPAQPDSFHENAYGPPFASAFW